MNMQSIAVSELNIYAAIFDAAIHFCITGPFLRTVCKWASRVRAGNDGR
jgi:hypothetical protein|tara:strand:+ start:589 stop:735 length:147 start_codon:yes stop_codon:yes gene_type:complete